MKLDDGLRVGDELRKFAEQEKKQRHLKEQLAKRQRKERESDDLWRSAWKALAGDTIGPWTYWSDDCPERVRTLARLQSEIERDRVRTIRQRLGKWLRRKDRHELVSPLIELKPLSGNPADEGFISDIKGVFVAAAILERSYEPDAEPLVPEDIDTFDLRSFSWQNLWSEVLREDGRSIEPSPPDRKRRCGEGHEWEVKPGHEYPLRCPTCEEQVAERERGKVKLTSPTADAEKPQPRKAGARLQRAVKTVDHRDTFEVLLAILRQAHGYDTDQFVDEPFQSQADFARYVKTQLPTDSTTPCSKSTVSRFFKDLTGKDKKPGWSAYVTKCRQRTIQTLLAVRSGDLARTRTGSVLPHDAATED